MEEDQESADLYRHLYISSNEALVDRLIEKPEDPEPLTDEQRDLIMQVFLDRESRYSVEKYFQDKVKEQAFNIVFWLVLLPILSGSTIPTFHSDFPFIEKAGVAALEIGVPLIGILYNIPKLAEANNRKAVYEREKRAYLERTNRRGQV